MAMSTQSGENSRYTDLKDEPIDRLLSPIGGYEDKPLVSLAETVKPIATFFNDIQDYVYVALHNCQNPTDNLTQQESASIHLYTMQFHSRPSLYEVLNQSLRAQNRDKLIPWFSFLKLFLTALYKLPSQSGIVWRGIKNVDLSSKYKPGMKIAWWGVSSCTTHIQVLESNAFFGKHGLRTLFSIECINGKSVANHSYFKNTENEIILIPGSYFEVIGHLNPAPQLHIIQLKEITPPITFVKPPFAKSPNIIPFVINRPNTNPQPIANMIAQNTASNGFPQQISLKLNALATSPSTPAQSSSTHSLCSDCRARDVVYYAPIDRGPGYNAALRTPACVSLGFYVSSPGDYYARAHGYSYVRCNCVCHS